MTLATETCCRYVLKAVRAYEHRHFISQLYGSRTVTSDHLDTSAPSLSRITGGAGAEVSGHHHQLHEILLKLSSVSVSDVSRQPVCFEHTSSIANRMSQINFIHHVHGERKNT